MLHRRPGSDVFVLPVEAWRALTSAAWTVWGVVVPDDLSAEAGSVMAHLIADCPDDVLLYLDLYFGFCEPTPEMEAGRLWLSDPSRLKRLCGFLWGGKCIVEQDDGWTVLTRRML
jgi:hypothetical protein